MSLSCISDKEINIFPFLMASAILVFYDPMVLGDPCRAFATEGSLHNMSSTPQ